MSVDQLEPLARKYPRGDTFQLFALARKRALEGELAILELAALAVERTPEDILDTTHGSDADTLVRSALIKDSGGADREFLAGLSSEQLHEHSDTIKYCYFQLLCVDHLNRGENLGGVQLQKEQRAELIAATEGLELELLITNENGSTNELLQSKVNVNMGLVWEALELAPAQGSSGLRRAVLFASARGLLRVAGVPLPIINAAMQGSNLLVSRYNNLATMANIAREHADTLTALTPQPAAD